MIVSDPPGAEKGNCFPIKRGKRLRVHTIYPGKVSRKQSLNRFRGTCMTRLGIEEKEFRFWGILTNFQSRVSNPTVKLLEDRQILSDCQKKSRIARGPVKYRARLPRRVAGNIRQRAAPG